MAPTSTYTSTILLTGGSSGLGLATAQRLARENPQTLLLITSRKDTGTAADINRQTGQANVHFLPLDLSTRAGVRSAVKLYAAGNYPAISALIMNAGIQVHAGLIRTADDIESTFATNVAGHALLFNLIKPYLSTTARIVIVASGTHDPAQKTGVPAPNYVTAEEIARPTNSKATSSTDCARRYSTSKLCNVMYGYALARHIKEQQQAGSAAGKHWQVLTMDPGLMPGTGLIRDAGPVMQFLANKVMPAMSFIMRRVMSNCHTPEESGAAVVRLATSAEFSGKSGLYFEGTREIKSSTTSYERAKQDDLWQWLLNFTAASPAELKEFQQL